MKTKIITLLSVAALFTGCSNDESNQQPTDANVSQITSVYQKPVSLDVQNPLSSCSYEVADGVCYLNFAIPDNYFYSVDIENGKYFIDLTTQDAEDGLNHIQNTETLYFINGVVDFSFRVNGVAIKKPQAIVTD